MSALLLAALLAAPPEPALAITPDDYAYGFVLAIDDAHGIQELTLPPPVYELSVQPDLADVVVFNGKGELVPRSLREPPPSTSAPSDRVLPIFPLRAPASRPLEGLSISVRRDASGAVAHVETGATAASPVRAWLVDAGWVETAIVALRLELESPEPDFVHYATIEASDDLMTFHPLVHDVAVASLRHAGFTIDRQRVELPAVRPRYLRIAFAGDGARPELARVTAELAQRRDEPQRAWVPVGEVRRGQAPASYELTLAGFFPVDRLRVSLPERNTVVQATLAARATNGAAERQLWSGLLYRLVSRGEEVSSAAATFAPARARNFLLGVSGAGGGLGAELPRAEAGYLPDELVFAARGEGPFTLAVGSAETRAVPFTAAELTALAHTAVGDTSIGRATLGERRELGGADKLRPAPPDRAPLFRRVGLWAALLVAVTLLGFMSIRLLRELGRG